MSPAISPAMSMEGQATCPETVGAPCLPDSGGGWSFVLLASCLLGFSLASLLVSFLASFY